MLCWVFRFSFLTTIPSDINGYQGYPQKRKHDLREDSQSFSGVGPRIVALPLFIPYAPKNSHQGMRCASLSSFTKSRPRPWFHWHFDRRSMDLHEFGSLAPTTLKHFRHLRIRSSSQVGGGIVVIWKWLRSSQIFAGGKAFKNLSASVTLFFFKWADSWMILSSYQPLIFKSPNLINLWVIQTRYDLLEEIDFSYLLQSGGRQMPAAFPWQPEQPIATPTSKKTLIARPQGGKWWEMVKQTKSPPKKKSSKQQ